MDIECFYSRGYHRARSSFATKSTIRLGDPFSKAASPTYTVLSSSRPLAQVYRRSVVFHSHRSRLAADHPAKPYNTNCANQLTASPCNLPVPLSLSTLVYPLAYTILLTVHTAPVTALASGNLVPAISIAGKAMM